MYMHSETIVSTLTCVVILNIQIFLICNFKAIKQNRYFRLSPKTHLVHTYIHEKMNKLYDNEWLESKEVLEKNRNEKTAIEILLIILMVRCLIFSYRKDVVSKIVCT